MEDILSQLLEWSFRGIAFPATGHSVSGAQSHVAHQPMDRDACLIETTGRESDRFEVDCLFDNGVSKGEGETWSDLYPNTFLRFLDALRDRSTGELSHPLRGPIQVKAVSWQEKIDPNRRSGVTLSVVFVETNDEDAADQSLLAASPLAFATAEAVNLDAELAALDPPLPTEGLEEGSSLEDIAGDIKGAVDSVGLAANQVAGKVNGAIGAVTGIADSVDRLGSTIGSAAGSIADSANRALDALNRLKQTITQEEQASTGIKIADGDWSWAQAMQATANSLSDLQKLNPHLGGKSTIAKGSLVKHKK